MTEEVRHLIIAAAIVVLLAIYLWLGARTHRS